MTYYAVIDTNVLVSALLKEKSNPDKIIKAVADEVIIPLIDRDIFEEYIEVLHRSKFHIRSGDV